MRYLISKMLLILWVSGAATILRYNQIKDYLYISFTKRINLPLQSITLPHSFPATRPLPLSHRYHHNTRVILTHYYQDTM